MNGAVVHGAPDVLNGPRRTTTSTRLWLAILAAVVAVSAAFSSSETIDVTAPLATILITATAFLWSLSCRRYGVTPWFELGAVYATVVTVYAAYPLIGFLALGQAYTPLNDSRLYSLQPSAAEVGSVAWLYVSHIGSFAIAYTMLRGRLPVVARPLRRPDFAIFVAAVAVYLLIEAFGVFVGLFFNMTASTYAETYLMSRRLPLVVAQVLNHLTGAKFAVSIIVLAALFSNYRKHRLLILAWLVAVSVMTAVRLGSRTDLVLLLMGAAMMYQLVVRPLPLRLVVAAGSLGLIGFLSLGVLRSMRAGALETTSANPFVYASEFETLFANATHLNGVKDEIVELPPSFYFADLGALVPQQLAPFAKVDRADWYVSTFFPEYAAIGGGVAFGTIAEAILAGGWLAAAGFGAALGFAFAGIHRFYARRADRFWVLVFYVWVTALSYQAFRNTTFSLLVLFVYRFIPAFIAVTVLAYAIRRLPGGRRAAVSQTAVTV